MARIPTVDDLFSACANVWDMTVGPGVADLTPTPSAIIDAGPQRTVHRYRPTNRRRRHAPVLLVPPLAAPARCFDLRRGASLAQHLLALGYPTYLVDYGPISYSDRQLGLEHWVDDVIPTALDKRITKPLTPAQHHEPRPTGPHRGRGQLHGEHAGLPRPHVRTAVPPL